MRNGATFALQTVSAILFGLTLGFGLLAGGLLVAPNVGLAAQPSISPPRRPPVIPPAVPAGAPEAWALWSYLDKIGPLWGRDWPTVTRFLEEFLVRYPGNRTAVDTLYAAYIEDGKERAASGDWPGARRRFQQATTLEPDRGEAFVFLDELDAAP